MRAQKNLPDQLKLSDFEDKSLLILDDDDPLRGRLARAMEKKGFQVKEAKTVAEGLNIVKVSPPSFACVDLRLEDGNGLDVIKELTRNKKDSRIVMHQEQNPDKHMTIDSIREFRELTEIKLQSKQSGLLMVGGGVPKNFIQDTVVCAELLGKKVDMHKYAIQITVADTRDGACSSSTLKEASSWGKVDITKEQMVFAEATSVLPLIASDAYHRANWKNRDKKNFSNIFK
jgi:CheY-like chemotaxis protein